MEDELLYFMHCAHMPVCDAWVDKHFDGYYSLQLITGGKAIVHYDEVGHRLLPGCFWPAYPGPRIRMNPAEGCPSWDHRYVAFRGPLAAQWQAQGLLPSVPQMSPQNGTDYTRLFDDLLSRISDNKPWASRRAINLLERILLELAEARAAEHSRQPWLELVTGLLAKSTTFIPDYESIASAAKMSFRTLREQFKRATGVPIHTYVIQLRIGRARALLGDSDQPIKAIAETLGYDDVFFFTKQFKKLTGTTPAAFRQSRFVS